MQSISKLVRTFSLRREIQTMLTDGALRASRLNQLLILVLYTVIIQVNTVTFRASEFH